MILHFVSLGTQKWFPVEPPMKPRPFNHLGNHFLTVPQNV